MLDSFLGGSRDLKSVQWCMGHLADDRLTAVVKTAWTTSPWCGKKPAGEGSRNSLLLAKDGEEPTCQQCQGREHMAKVAAEIQKGWTKNGQWMWKHEDGRVIRKFRGGDLNTIDKDGLIYAGDDMLAAMATQRMVECPFCKRTVDKTKHSIAGCREMQQDGKLHPLPEQMKQTLDSIEPTPTGRDFTAWVGLVPKQHSTGGKTNLLGISKRGNAYLHRPFVHAARSVVANADRSRHPLGAWINQLESRVHSNALIVAVANKVARITWAVLATGQSYRGISPAAS